MDKKTEKAEKSKVEIKAEKVNVLSGNFIMKVTHLPWGANGRNHFFAKKKPLINTKVMGKFANTLKIWLDNGWIEKGDYKK